MIMAGRMNKIHESNPKSQNRLVLFGAGMTGRGQISQLAFEAGWNLTLVDKNERLVDQLRGAGHYTVRLLGNKNREVDIHGYQAYHTSEIESIYEAINQADLVVTSVLEPNLCDVATILAPALGNRITSGIKREVNIISAENMGDSTSHLRNYVSSHIPENLFQDILMVVGFPNSMISRVVPISDDPLCIITEEYSEWTADRYAVVGQPPRLAGLEWVENQPARLCRKLFIHNTGHMICGILGWLGNYSYIHEAAQNPDIMGHIEGAIDESGEAVSKEYGFDRLEVKQYEEHLLGRLIISALADDIRRVIRHPVRKLGKEERLIGPLLLCEKHDLPRVELCYGIAAVLAGSFIPYDFHEYDNQADDIRITLEKVGPIQTLYELVGYQPNPISSKLIIDAYTTIYSQYIAPIAQDPDKLLRQGIK
jgi:mannitol-1-phosphate 5-dehydrogenase